MMPLNACYTMQNSEKGIQSSNSAAMTNENATAHLPSSANPLATTLHFIREKWKRKGEKLTNTDPAAQY